MKKKKKLSVYLAGGFMSSWQDKVIELMPGAIIFDPREHKLDQPAEYTAWDLNAIDNSDLIIAYMEKGNPGGYALSLEIGYAKAQRKKIIIIDEHDDTQRRRYFEMVREVSDMCIDSFPYFISNFEEVVEGVMNE